MKGNENMTDELKTCPFCGGLMFYFETKPEAKEAWNARQIETELHEKIGKLEAENKRLREALAFYAHGKHLWDAYERDPACDAYDRVSGQVENGKYAREVLEGGAE